MKTKNFQPLTQEAFEEKIRREFIEGSAIFPDQYEAAVRLVSDIEMSPGGDASHPIHEGLNWKPPTRFGHQANPTQFAALLVNGDGSTWQAKLFPARPGVKYETPVGSGSRAYFPDVPPSSRMEIAQRFGIKVPLEGNFWEWLKDHPEIPITLTEGGKKGLCGLSHGFPTIALLGCHGGYRVKDEQGHSLPRTLIDDLQPFAVEGREFIIALDQDEKPQTQKTVGIAIFQLGRLLVERGCTVRVATWNGEQGQCKGLDDLVANRGIEALDQAIAKALEFKEWKKKHFVERYTLSHKPDVEITDREKIGDIALPDPIPGRRQLAAVKGEKSCGKTHWAANGPIKYAIDKEYQTIGLTYRIQLGRQQSDRFGLPYRDEVEKYRLEAENFGFALCVDSLHRLGEVGYDARKHKKKVVVIDESVSVRDHLLTSSTCSKNRPAILLNLRMLLQNAERVILMDADLDDQTVKFFRDLMGENVDIFTIVHSWKDTQPRQAYEYPDPATLLAALEERIKKSDQPQFVFTGGQRANSTWGTQTLEIRAKELAPDKRVIRIDSETVSDPSHEAFGCVGEGLSEWIKNFDIVIASPVIESGVSINLYNHFENIWCFATGVQSPRTVRQAMARVRDFSAPRHYYAPDQGLNFIGGSETSSEAVWESQHEQLKSNIDQYRKLVSEGMVLDDCLGFAPFIAPLEAYCHVVSRHNREMWNYRGNLRSGLEQEGYEITTIPGLTDEERAAVKEAVKNVKGENYSRYCEDVSSPTNPIQTDDEYQTLKNKRDKTKDDRNRERNWELRQRYPGTEITPDRVRWDDDGLYPQMQLHYYLTAGEEFLPNRERQLVENLAPDGILWGPDYNWRSMGAKIAALEYLGVKEYIERAEAGEVFSENHPLVQGKTPLIKKFRTEVRLLFGVPIGDDESPMAIWQKLSQKCFGFRLERGQRRISGTNKREWIYYYVQPEDRREDIFTAWLERDRVAMVPPEPVPAVEPEPPIALVVTPEDTHQASDNNIITVTANALNIFKANEVIDSPHRTAFSPPDTKESPAVRGSPEKIKLIPGMVVRWGQRSGEWLVRTVGTAIAILARPDGTLEWSAALSELEVV